MGVKVVVREVAEGDAEALAANLRAADRAELIATKGEAIDLEELVRQSVRRSTLAWTAEVNGDLCCLFGVGAATILSSSGHPWLLATPTLEQHPVSFIRRSRRYLRRMTALYPHLENYVDVRNEAAVHWLKWLGFTLHDPAPYGVAGLPFHHFELEV